MEMGTGLVLKELLTKIELTDLLRKPENMQEVLSYLVKGSGKPFLSQIKDLRIFRVTLTRYLRIKVGSTGVIG